MQLSDSCQPLLLTLPVRCRNPNPAQTHSTVETIGSKTREHHDLSTKLCVGGGWWWWGGALQQACAWATTTGPPQTTAASRRQTVTLHRLSDIIGLHNHQSQQLHLQAQSDDFFHTTNFTSPTVSHKSVQWESQESQGYSPGFASWLQCPV